MNIHKRSQRDIKIISGQFLFIFGFVFLFISGVFSVHPLHWIDIGEDSLDFLEGFFLGMALPILVFSVIKYIKVITNRRSQEQ